MRKVILSAFCLFVASVSFLSGQNALFRDDARIESAMTLSPEAAFAPAACTTNSTTLCLNAARFQASVIFSAPSLGITNAPAQAVPLTSDTGYFWFFSANNVEIVLKVVDGRAFNNFFWVFEGALTDVAYTITVTDTQTGAVKTYSNPAGHLGSFADTAAFGGGTSPCTYIVSPLTQSFTGTGGAGSVTVSTSPGCAWTASTNSTFLAITSGAAGTGTGTVTYSVAANPSLVARSGTLTVAGQTVTINQGGGSGGGAPYDGAWSGTTAETCPNPSPAHPCPVTFNVSNNALTNFSITFPLTGNCSQAGLAVVFNTPAQITNGQFSFSSSSGGNSLTVSATKTSNTTATGTATYTFQQTVPIACSGSGSTSWSASR